MEWDSYRGAFVSDGFSRHIRVSGVTLSDWDTYYRLLRGSQADIRYFRDGDAEALPQHIDERPFQSGHRFMLILDMGGVRLTAHLQDSRVIDFQFHPEAVSSPAQATLLFRVMSTLGRRLDREAVMLHPEDGRVLFRYRPDLGEVEYRDA